MCPFLNWFMRTDEDEEDCGFFFLSCIWRCNYGETWAILFRNCCIYRKSMNHGRCFQLSKKPYWLLTFSLSFVQFPSKVNVHAYRVSHKPAAHDYGTSASGAFLEQLALWWRSGKRWKLGKKTCGRSCRLKVSVEFNGSSSFGRKTCC